MSKQSKNLNRQSSFFTFLFEKEQKRRLLFYGIFYLITYLVLVYLYPFPDGISDSGGYVQSASQNKYLGYRPFGYSKFLIILHDISTSISFVVFVQYWLNAISTVFFIFTIKYFYKPQNKLVELIFEVLSVCSITVIYLTNCILSDSLFTSLTILWMISSIWFINAPKISHKTILFLFHVILLGFIFCIRFIGLFYIGITILIVLITLFKQKKLIAIIFIIVPIALFSLLYKNQINSSYQLTRIKTFSGFSGWQMANNALHVIPYLTSADTTKIRNREVKEFTAYALSCKSEILKNIKPYHTNAGFMWDKNLPLKKFLFYKINQRNSDYITTFTYLGENVYSKFASNIMTQHPFLFLRHFILPNTLGVLYPSHDDVCESYTANLIPSNLLKDWFEIDEKTTFYSRSEIVGKVSGIFPVFQLFIWILFFVSVFFHLIKRYNKYWNPVQIKIFWSIVFFIGAYFVFNIYASTFAIRYINTIHLLQISIIYAVINNHLKHKSQPDY